MFENYGKKEIKVITLSIIFNDTTADQILEEQIVNVKDLLITLKEIK